jgi:hypothetical protein
LTSGALALSFADVDADGQEELVVATASELWVYESDGADPIASPRAAGEIRDMVAGDFDATPGEDVLLLLSGDSLALHNSIGDGTFGPGASNPTPIGFLTGLVAGDFDGQPPSDLLAWGGAGAYVDLAGQIIVLDEGQIASAAVHDLGSPEPSIALWRDTTVDIYALDVQPITSWTEVPGVPMLAPFWREFTSEYAIVSAHYDTWSRVQSRNLNQEIDEWSIHGTPSLIFAGDLDHSQTDELVFFDEMDPDLPNAFVQFNPLQDGDCWHPLPVPGRGNPVEAVFGDHDGDGDEELAFRTDLGEAALFDGG